MAIEFVIDTGFTDQLTLPLEAVGRMGLQPLNRIAVDLADGSIVELPMYEAMIAWGNADRQVRILATGRRPLLGTALLDDLDLFVGFREGGPVTVKTHEELE